MIWIIWWLLELHLQFMEKPAERVMSELNLALQTVGIMRQKCHQLLLRKF